MKGTVAIASVMLAIIGPIASQRASAQSDEWRFQAVIYGYFPDISGNSTFSTASGTPSITIDSSKIIDSLKFAFMGEFEGHKGRWGFLTDILYMDLGGSKSATRDLTIGGIQLPSGVTANASLDIKGTVWELAGLYSVVNDPGATLYVVAGARLLDYKQTLGWEFSADLGPLQPSRSGSSVIKLTNWDGIVGVKGRLSFGENRAWFVPYYLDVGTGDSDLTWQAIAGLGYSFKWGDVVAGWRYLDYNFKSGSKFEDANFSGPLVGVAFHW